MERETNDQTTLDLRCFDLHVDSDNRILDVNDEWVCFGNENNYRFGGRHQIVGRQLFEFMTDASTQQIYAGLMTRVRKLGKAATIPFRCDGPELRRFMEMEVSPLSGNGIRFRSRIVREERRPRVEFLDPSAPRSRKLIRMCGWCKKVAIPEWVEIEEGLQRMQWFHEMPMPGITHGICPACEVAMAEELDRLMQADIKSQ